jgi:chemotaxis protein MotA
MKPDIASLAGVAIALGAIAAGLLLEGGKIGDIAQYTAAIIVLGGTAGAVMVSTPPGLLLRAAKRLRSVFFDASEDLGKLSSEFLELAAKARKQGLASLESDADAVKDPFLKKALNLAVDGTDLREIQQMLSLEIETREQEGEAEARVFECAGGYSPTVGIIGAVLGLIQVMKNLANIDEVGHGIAVSFVATVYGVAVANLFFLPAAAKIKARIHDDTKRMALITEAVGGLVEGLNPKLLAVKLDVFAHGAGQAKKGGAPAAKAPAQA